MSFPRRLADLLLVLTLAFGASAKAGAVELTVSAASSLGNALRDIAPLFEAAHPGTRLQYNVAASGALLQQIAKGAPVDVLISADQETMDQAQRQALVLAPLRRNVASNALVLIVPARSAAVPKALAELTQPAYARIAIGLPGSVPVGRYTQGVLETAGLWATLSPRVIGANNVRQVLDYVARAEVDAGFVYATDAALMPDKVRVAFVVPTAQPILYPAAALASAPLPAAAQRFVEFLLAPAAQTVLARHGFGKP